MAKIRDPMPKKLLVLVVWLVLGLVMTVVQGALGGGVLSWVSVLVSALLIVGVLVGSEGARLWLMFGAIAGLLMGGVGAFGLLVAGKGMGIARGLGLIVLSVAPSAYMLWCLRQQDVQQWMFYRSLGSEADE
ncbi:MAG: hypothetical protein GYA57_11395 [Myxococcales bacterium]|nr:hypothetical protein [Myxococcales bacterium]